MVTGRRGEEDKCKPGSPQRCLHLEVTAKDGYGDEEVQGEERTRR